MGQLISVVPMQKMRLTRANYQAWLKSLQENQVVDLMVSRLGELKKVQLIAESKPELVSAITISDKKLFEAAHLFRV
jgi:hypothetical protein